MVPIIKVDFISIISSEVKIPDSRITLECDYTKTITAGIDGINRAVIRFHKK